MATDWRSLILKMEPRARLGEPATEADIAQAERAIGFSFPADLHSLIRQANGIWDEGLTGPMMPLAAVCFPPPVNPNFRLSEPTLYGNGIVNTTLSLRSPEFAQDNDWDDTIITMLSTFVVLGLDCAGGPFGFFGGGLAETVSVRYVEHDSGELDETAYSLEEYLCFYFQHAANFQYRA